MRKYVLTLAVLAAASLPSLARADDAKEQNTSPAIGSVQLSDAEMDQVTAGRRPDWAGYGKPYFAGSKPHFAGQGKPEWAGPPLN